MTRRHPKLVWSARPSPPPEHMLLAAAELGLHMGSLRRNTRDQRYLLRFAKRAEVLQERVRKAAIYDQDDIYGAVALVFHEVIEPMCRRDGGASLIFAREILEKTLEWLKAQPPAGGAPPRLVG
jgi:hypothetical protein